jgi:methionyl aminopeptidase
MIKTVAEITAMRVAGGLTAEVLQALNTFIRPGISTMQINQFCEDYIVNSLQARPASKGQYDYPYCVNTSVNHVICHGVPSEKQILKHGDIVNVDVTVEKNGFIGDSSKTYAVGTIQLHAQRLLDVSQQCLYRAIACVRPDATLGDIGHAIQRHAEEHHYSVVREYCGHGIGREMHEEPQVLHFGSPGTGMRLQAGMTFTIEPMINQGRRQVKQHPDGWTVTTKDKRLSAQWEHTLLVTSDGVEILTLREEEKHLFA